MLPNLQEIPPFPPCLFSAASEESSSATKLQEEITTTALTFFNSFSQDNPNFRKQKRDWTTEKKFYILKIGQEFNVFRIIAPPTSSHGYTKIELQETKTNKLFTLKKPTISSFINNTPGVVSEADINTEHFTQLEGLRREHELFNQINSHHAHSVVDCIEEIEGSLRPGLENNKYTPLLTPLQSGDPQYLKSRLFEFLQLLSSLEKAHRSKVFVNAISLKNIGIHTSPGSPYNYVYFSDFTNAINSENLKKFRPKFSEKCFVTKEDLLELDREISSNILESMDIFALGIIFFSMLGSKKKSLPHPYSLDDYGYPTLSPSPAPLPESIPDPIRELVYKMVAKNRNMRPSAKEALKVLSAYLKKQDQQSFHLFNTYLTTPDFYLKFFNRSDELSPPIKLSSTRKKLEFPDASQKSSDLSERNVIQIPLTEEEYTKLKEMSKRDSFREEVESKAFSEYLQRKQMGFINVGGDINLCLFICSIGKGEGAKVIQAYQINNLAMTAIKYPNKKSPQIANECQLLNQLHPQQTPLWGLVLPWTKATICDEPTDYISIGSVYEDNYSTVIKSFFNQLYSKRLKEIPYRLFELQQLLFALVEIHREDIIHGDLKPDNVLVKDVPGTPYKLAHIADLGGAVKVLESSTEIHPIFTCSFTPYDEKKQLMKSPNLALAKSMDVFSLGSIFFQVFGFNSITLPYQLRSNKFPDFRYPNPYAPSLPIKIKELISSMTCPDWETRFSAKQAYQSLMDCIKTDYQELYEYILIAMETATSSAFNQEAYTHTFLEREAKFPGDAMQDSSEGSANESSSENSMRESPRYLPEIGLPVTPIDLSAREIPAASCLAAAAYC